VKEDIRAIEGELVFVPNHFAALPRDAEVGAKSVGEAVKDVRTTQKVGHGNPTRENIVTEVMFVLLTNGLVLVGANLLERIATSLGCLLPRAARERRRSRSVPDARLEGPDGNCHMRAVCKLHLRLKLGHEGVPERRERSKNLARDCIARRAEAHAVTCTLGVHKRGVQGGKV
jgi:hypothetical protein